MHIFLRPEHRRCSIKGCVFPASAGETGKCSHHELEELEPTLFLSLQPTHWVLDYAKYGLAAAKCPSPAARDRRRLAAQREEFLEDVA